MSTDHTALVAKVWNYAHVLRDQGIGYGDYVEQITFLLLLRMDQERTALLGEPSGIPEPWRWGRLAPLDGMSASMRREAAHSAALRQSFLKAAFSGQLVPQDPRDEPAAALRSRLAAQAAAAPAVPRRRGSPSTARA